MSRDDGREIWTSGLNRIWPRSRDYFCFRVAVRTRKRGERLIGSPGESEGVEQEEILGERPE